MLTPKGALRACTGPLVALALAAACGGKGEAKSPATDPTASASTIAAPPPACADAPANPGEVIAKEPNVFSACLAGAAKPGPNPCGSAKIAVTIGKDGRVSDAQVAQSTLPEGATDCIKARLAAMQFACPKEGSATYTIPVGFPGATPSGGCPGLPGAPASGTP